MKLTIFLSISTGIVFSIIGFLAAIISFISTVISIRIRSKAEKDLYLLMQQNNLELQEKIIELQKLELMSKDDMAQVKEFKEIDFILNKLTQTLDEKERRQIFIGLNQPILESKVDYIDKLLIQSGSTETHIFKK